MSWTNEEITASLSHPEKNLPEDALKLGPNAVISIKADSEKLTFWR